MSTLRLGALLAALVAGPPLYGLVQDGGLDADSGLLRWALVAGGCVVGAGWVRSLVQGYAAEGERRRREEAFEEARAALEQQQQQQQQRRAG